MQYQIRLDGSDLGGLIYPMKAALLEIFGKPLKQIQIQRSDILDISHERHIRQTFQSINIDLNNIYTKCSLYNIQSIYKVVRLCRVTA